MNNTTVDAIGTALAYYTIPTITGSTVINAAKLAQVSSEKISISRNRRHSCWSALFESRLFR